MQGKPMRRSMLGIAAGLLVVVFSLGAKPQAPGAGSIEGIIVRLGSGESIPGVNVELRRVEGTAAAPLGPLVFGRGYYSPGAVVRPDSPSPGDLLFARTNDAGRFVFTNLKPGKYRLTAAHPEGTYYPAEYGQRHPRGRGYDFTLEGTPSMQIRLQMAPMASVSGRVIGADGKPAAHVHVIAAEIAYKDGARVLNQVQGVETDDRGDYRLFWLPPGRYSIGAFPEGLRRRNFSVAFGPPGTIESLNQTFPQALIHYRTGAGGEVVEEVYETVYAPGETNPDSARVFDLRLGTNVTGVDIPLAAGRRRGMRIRGVVIDAATRQPARNISVRASPRNAGPIKVAPRVTTDANGLFEISGLQGSYFVVATTQDANEARPTAVQFVDVGGVNIEGLRLVLGSGLNLSGRITMDGRQTDAYRVFLSPEDSSLPEVISRESRDSLLFPDVQPVKYRVTAVPRPGSTPGPEAYVKSIRFGGVEILNGEIRPSGALLGDIEVVLGQNAGSIEGRVNDGQGSAANVRVVLVPESPGRLDLFKSATTDAAGRFRFQGVAPGNYAAFAWPWLPEGIWQVPDFLRSVQSRGKAVTISERANVDLELSLLPEVNF
jgi:hypothetical protein